MNMPRKQQISAVLLRLNTEWGQQKGLINNNVIFLAEERFFIRKFEKFLIQSSKDVEMIKKVF